MLATDVCLKSYLIFIDFSFRGTLWKRTLYCIMLPPTKGFVDMFPQISLASEGYFTEDIRWQFAPTLSRLEGARWGRRAEWVQNGVLRMVEPWVWIPCDYRWYHDRIRWLMLGMLSYSCRELLLDSGSGVLAPKCLFDFHSPRVGDPWVYCVNLSQ